jgi:hypothetical protein
MGEMFNVNLISQIQGTDKKFSISKEQPHLKRKAPDVSKHGSRHNNDRRTAKNIDYYNNNDNFSGEDEGDHTGINITV